MGRAVVFGLGALLGAAAPLPLAAQEPAERARLDSLRAAVFALPDSAALAARERQRIEVARANRDDPFIHMELGWLAFRLGEVTGVKQKYDEAAGEFEWATELRPRWAYAWHWLGIAELNIGEADMIVLENIRQVLGMDHLSKAARAFARAIEADPGFTQALIDLATTTLEQRARGRVMVALQALRNAAATAAGRAPAVWLLRGRLERRVGAADSALVAFRRYQAVGGDTVVGRVEEARALAALERGDSAVAVYARALAATITDSGRAELRRDVAWIADAGELAVFDAAPAESVGALVAGFWNARDVDDARRHGERLVEQFRRYAYASANFQLVSRRRQFDPRFVLRDSVQNELDDRGVIYMRHGRPNDRVRWTQGGISESWRYLRQPPETDLVFHFAPFGDVQDYRMLESLASVCTTVRTDVPDFRTAVERVEPTMSPDCFGARAAFGAVYERLQRTNQLSATYDNLLASERDMVRRSARAGVTSDSYRLTFSGDLRPVLSTFVVADRARRPELHVVFAVPAGRLHPIETAGGLIYPLLLRVVVFDSAGREIATLDTARTFRAPTELGANAFLTEQLVMRVPPGTWRAHLVIAERESGYGTMVRDQRVDAYDMTRGFAASDVVVGLEQSGLVWRRGAAGGGDVPLNPLARFPEGSALLLFYELYGLPRGASVDTRVVITPERGRSIFRRIFGGRSGGDLSYSTVTDTADRAAVRQRLDLVGLGSGRYTLEVTLTDPASGLRLVRRDRFEIGG